VGTSKKYVEGWEHVFGRKAASNRPVEKGKKIAGKRGAARKAKASAGKRARAAGKKR
jgi:hypothetical protein